MPADVACMTPSLSFGFAGPGPGAPAKRSGIRSCARGLVKAWLATSECPLTPAGLGVSNTQLCGEERTTDLPLSG